jgi:hypothetical protein
MNSRIFGKLIAILCFAILYAWFANHTHNTRMEMGRDAFLAKEGEYFDKHYTHTHALPLVFIICLLLTSIFFGIYELVAFVGSLIGKSLDLDRGD